MKHLTLLICCFTLIATFLNAAEAPDAQQKPKREFPGGWELHRAIFDQDVDKVRAILAKPTDEQDRYNELNFKITHIGTSLHYAVEFGGSRSAEIGEILLDAGARLDAFDDNYYTPAMLAAASGNIDFILMLHKRYPTFIRSVIVRHLPDAGEGYESRTYLVHIAARYGQSAMIRKLRELGTDVTVRDECQQTPLHYAVKNLQLEAAQTLVELGASLTAVDNRGDTPLHIAMHHAPKPELVQLLIGDGSSCVMTNINHLYPIDIIPEPIHHPFSDEPPTQPEQELTSLELLQLAMLFQYVAHDIPPRSELGRKVLALRTALGATGKEEAFGQFVDEAARADLMTLQAFIDELKLHHIALNDFYNKKHETVLHGLLNYCHTPNLKVIKLLLEEGCDANARDERGNTPLFNLASYDYLNIDKLKLSIDLLIKHEANPQAENSAKQTPLHWAVWCGAYDFITIMLDKYHVQVDAMDKNGKTPLHCVRYEWTARMLLEHGANPDARDREGRTPRHSFDSSRHEAWSFKHLFEQYPPRAAPAQTIVPAHAAVDAAAADSAQTPHNGTAPAGASSITACGRLTFTPYAVKE